MTAAAGSGGPRPQRGLRRRIRDSIVLVAVAALLLFGVPLAVAFDRLTASQALARLQRDATRALALVPDEGLASGRLRVPPPVGDTRVGIYDPRGTRLAGFGPARSALAGQVADGREHDGTDAGELAVVVPVLSDRTVVGGVRAAVPSRLLRDRVLRAWALLVLLALLVIGVALLLARRSAARISAPFEQLTRAARELGAGRVELDLPRWGLPEADDAGNALQDSARRVDELVRHERLFVRDASHQLRTPLAAVLLHLDRPEPDVAAALRRVRELELTIADLLALRGLGSHGSCDPGPVCRQAVARWNEPARPVRLRLDDVGPVALSEPALRQSLDVLLDNAVRHGSPPVTVTVEPLGDSVVVEVADGGPGFAADAKPGTGLTIVEGIVERAGGALLVRQRCPHPRVALLLPPAHEHQDGAAGAPVSSAPSGTRSPAE